MQLLIKLKELVNKTFSNLFQDTLATARWRHCRTTRQFSTVAAHDVANPVARQVPANFRRPSKAATTRSSWTSSGGVSSGTRRRECRRTPLCVTRGCDDACRDRRREEAAETEVPARRTTSWTVRPARWTRSAAPTRLRARGRTLKRRKRWTRSARFTLRLAWRLRQAARRWQPRLPRAGRLRTWTSSRGIRDLALWALCQRRALQSCPKFLNLL